MTVDIGGFTKIPHRFFGSGTAHSLKPSASLLYIALWDHANRNSTTTFKTSDKALASDTALSPRTICDARKRLIEERLITCTREDGQSYSYTLTVPDWNWVPVAKRPRAKCKPRAYHAQGPPEPPVVTKPKQ
jgi:Helix-turn-helix domain